MAGSHSGKTPVGSPVSALKTEVKHIQRPIHIPSSSSNVQSNNPSSALGICTTYVEVLRLEYLLHIEDPCHVCGIAVGRHPHDPHPHNYESRSSSRQLNLSQLPSSPRQLNVAKSFRHLKSTVLPTWKSSSVCHVFLAELNRCLKNSEIPEHEWFRAFAYISDDFMVADWIDRNIIDAKLSYNSACDLFRSHFESAAASELLAREYLTCSQKSNESVQLYADRFQSICARRGFPDSDVHAIEHFVEHLNPSIQKQYRTQIGIAKALGQSPDVSSLSKVLHLLLLWKLQLKVWNHIHHHIHQFLQVINILQQIHKVRSVFIIQILLHIQQMNVN